MSYDLHKQYINEIRDAGGKLVEITYNVPERFNFAYDVVDVIAEKSPDKLAMLWVDADGSDRSVSFGELKRESDKVASMLRERGFRRGDKCMLILKRRFEFWYAVIALHKLGVVGVPATNQLAEKDILYRFEAAGIKGVIALHDDHLNEEVEKAAAKYPGLAAKILVNGRREGWESFDEASAAAPPFVKPAPADLPRNDDMMLLYFTSGTTGMPKMVTHDFLYPLAHIVTAKYWHKVDPEGMHLTISETGWMKSVWGKLYGQWLMEGAIFVYDMDRFVPHDMLEKMEKYNITTFCAPPTMFRFFIKEDLTKYDLSSLQHVTIAGEALNPEVFEQFKKATGLKLMEGFGQTETTLTVANLYWMEPRPGSMGLPSPAYHVDIVDEEGKSCPPGVVGEIVVDVSKGKPIGMFSGYYRDEKTLQSVLHDGLYHTGDTAWKDEDGYFWYVGRTDDLIKSSGYRIGPFEVESVIMEHKAVLECAVTGVPDEVRGQVVKATVVLARGYEASEELKKEIQDYVKAHTAPYKYPRVIEFVPELPKTISGKIRRVVIRGGSDGE